MEANIVKRADGRSEMELRKTWIKTGVMNNAHGSAEINFGRTKVMCSAV